MPSVSVIVPAHQTDAAFEACVSSLLAVSPSPEEIIVADDSGSGACARAARRLGVSAVETPGHKGPAAARNLAARASRGDILLFVDADVRVPPGIVGYLRDHACWKTDVAAIFGSYDERPGHPGFLSQYKNLVHRYIHQTSCEEASTFWGACGAVRRDVFEAVGGFDERYDRPSVEDIEFGHRVRRAGHRIRLDRRLEVTHLKRWTARALLLSDVRDRAVPWTHLVLDRGHVPNDLNLRLASRVAAATACLTVAMLLGVVVRPHLWPMVPPLLGLLVALDAPLWRYLLSARGWTFLARSMAWHWFYYVYSSLTFGAVALATWVNDRAVRPERHQHP